jgi:hypothetical protein
MAATMNPQVQLLFQSLLQLQVQSQKNLRLEQGGEPAGQRHYWNKNWNNDWNNSWNNPASADRAGRLHDGPVTQPGQGTPRRSQQPASFADGALRRSP